MLILPVLFASALADSDIALEKSVTDPVLAPGAAVEFTIRVRNLGPDPAYTVYVIDALPSALVIPVGVSPFTSLGTFDTASGRWSIDFLDVGASAELVLPAQVIADPLPSSTADAIAARPVWRAIVRALLWPVVMAVVHPLSAALAGALCLGLGLLLYRELTGVIDERFGARRIKT